MIAKLLKGSFTTESVLAAQNAVWDKKTGMVTSSHLFPMKTFTSAKYRTVGLIWLWENLQLRVTRMQQ